MHKSCVDPQMSTSKVIFTYKRKRLSSRSGVDHPDVCTDISLDGQAVKQTDVPNKKFRSQDKDPMILNCVNYTDVECAINSSLEPLDNQQTALHLQDACCGEKSINSSRLDKEHDVQRSDTTCSMTAVIEKDCIQQSDSKDMKGFMNGGSVSQLENNSMSSPLCEVAKDKSIVPLRTFSRRLKRKLGESGMGLFTELPLGEGDTSIKECNSFPELLCESEVALKEKRLVEKSVDLVMENNDADLRNIVCQNSEKMISVERGNSSCLCKQSCAESPTSRHNEVTSTSHKGMDVNISPSKLTANRISESISNHHNLDTIPKDEVNCSINDEVMASWNTSSKIDEQPFSQLQASSGDSQLTSGRIQDSTRSNSLDPTRPPPGGFVIDCNVVPESDTQEDAPDIIQGSSTMRQSEIVRAEGHNKSEGLELFGDQKVLMEDLDGVHTSLPTETKHKTTYLQLFPENETCGQLTLSNTQFETSQTPHLAQSNKQAPPALGLSLHTEQKFEGPTSSEGPIKHQFQNPNVRIHDLIQNPHVRPFPDPSSLRHKLLLESINTRATSLRGNRNISLDNFDPTPSVWSEEELDSLWIGIRRYGRGHWRAMLLDPRLRFAPWRVAGELEEQWERELYKLFSGQHMPSIRITNPQDAYKLHFQGGPICPGTSSGREIGTDTRLTLGDLYGQRDNVSFQGNAQNLVTMASSGPGFYGFNPFNNALGNGMNCLPHWLRDSLPPSSNLAPMRGIDHVNSFPGSSGISCKGANNKVDENAKNRHLTKKAIMADNLIVIDSDASSEETISDDKNVRI